MAYPQTTWFKWTNSYIYLVAVYSKILTQLTVKTLSTDLVYKV